ncbi:phosphatidylserine/phosphatidylglycerophosphate/cardiolipin synthase family protein [bacterium]|nr:phosphatidylserine/phosphatidylglycerophosphate/cardiolipin synthase family protein [bacterium]
MKIQAATTPILSRAYKAPTRPQTGPAPKDGFTASALPSLMARIPQLAAKLPAHQQVVAAQLEGLLQQALSDPAAEAEMLKLLATLNATGQLKPVLHQVAQQASQSGTLPPMPDAKRDALVNQLAGMIDAEFQAHGMTPATQGQVYQNWEQLAAENLSKVRNSQIPPRGPGQLSAFTEAAFVSEMEALQGAKFQSGNRITPLIDGPASFARRNQLIEDAKTSIHMMSWAFYDDETGWETARKLAEKKAQGLEVQVVVDGQVAANPGHNETLDFLQKQGVEVVRWRSTDRPYDGQHRKVLIVDGNQAVAGGLNVGNVYSHQGEGPKWRDTDVLIEGTAVGECEKLFAQIFGKGQSCQTAPVGSARSAVVNHIPGPKGDAHILLATLKAIQGASETIDIENAYVISTPDLRQSLLDALDRGVRVRVLTNSAESVDEPIVSAPILGSLPDLIQAGAEVYLKKGDTLHSKFMVVDGMYSSVGSYNLHPRSHRYEGEMTINTIDTQTAGQLTAAFENDIQQANRVESSDQIQIPKNTLTLLAARYFFDQL